MVRERWKDELGLGDVGSKGVSAENRRTRPPQRLETDEERKADDEAEVPVGVTAPEEAPEEAPEGGSDSEEREPTG